MTVMIDKIDRGFMRRAGRNDALPPIMTGSHIDTQPTGGKFDGNYGVLAGIEVVRTLNDHNIETEAPIEVAFWTNEEGSRFVPVMMGSGVFAKAFTLEHAHASKDTEGKSVKEELERALLKGKRSFAFETTLASKSFTRLIARAQPSGYRVTLLYVALPSAQLAKRRVARRVKEGGHSILDNIIERRFYRSLENLMYRYRVVVDEWFVYDNFELKTPALVPHGRRTGENIIEEQKWQRLLKLAKTNER